MTFIKSLDPKVLQSPRVSFGSVRTWTSHLNALKKMYGNRKIGSALRIRDDIMRQDFSLQKKRGMIVVLVKMYTHYVAHDAVSKQLSHDISTLNAASQTKRNKNDCTEHEVNVYRDVRKSIAKLMEQKEPPFSRLDLITMYLYTHVAARRGDVRFMRLVRYGPRVRDKPYIDLKKKLIFFPKHKTNIEALVSLEEHPLLLWHVAQLDVGNREPMYPHKFSRDEVDMDVIRSGQLWSLYIKKIFKTHMGFTVSIQKLRRLDACLISLDKDVVRRMKKNAQRQGHSYGTHVSTYMKMYDV